MRQCIGEVATNGDAIGLLLLWQNHFDACPDRPHLVPGSWISVQGRVNRKFRDFRVWEHREMLTYREPQLLGPMSGRAHFINEPEEASKVVNDYFDFG